MSIKNPELRAECPWVIEICTANDVLSKTEEYELILLARPAIWAARILNCGKYTHSLERRRKEIQALFDKGKAARDKLLNHNFRLIVHVAGKLKDRGLSWEEMIQHGADGFLYAVRKFKTASGNKLSTYATQWIRQRIGRAIENTGRIIRIPNNKQARINEVKFIYKRYVQNEQERPPAEEIVILYNEHYKKKKKANFKPIDREEVEEIGRILQEITSLNVSTGHDENLTVLDFLRDETATPVDIAERSLDKSYLLGLVSTLPLEEQAFIKFKYGLIDETPKSDAKVAEAFCITMKEVKEREARILTQLQNSARKGCTTLDFAEELFSVVFISAHEEDVPSFEQELGMKLSLPQKIYESPDKDQMVLLVARIRSLGGRAEVISSFG